MDDFVPIAFSTSGRLSRIVARGGSFYHSAATNWSTNRQVAEASMHDITVGMRVCVSYPAPSRNTK